MHPYRRYTAFATALLVALPLAVASAPANAEPPAARPVIPALRELAGGAPQVHDITLVTGDRVQVTIPASGKPQVETEVSARPDGRQVLVRALVDQDNLYVLPSDAAELVAAGRLDRRLFDVRRLIAENRTDGSAATVPVVVGYQGAGPDLRSARSRATAEKTLRARADELPGSREVRALDSINGAALDVAKNEAAAFWAQVSPRPGQLGAGLDRLWLDGTARVSLDVSVPLTGAPQAWAAGFDGTGVRVGVLDTGIDAQHPDLAGKVVTSQSFVQGQTVADGHGHGTHVAATIASTGDSFRGMAPGANLLVGKVCNDGGNCYDSDVIAGMEWAAADQDADIVSMSLGGDPTDGTDPVSMAVNTLTASTGALFVIAAGNEGAPRSVGSPGAADAALTVAAVDKSGQLTNFSSNGPRLGDYALKPELAAPGFEIVAAKPGGGHQPMSGTSMATPHVAGAAAILAQQHPDWTAAQLKAALIGTAKDDRFTVYQTGSGQLDVAAAVRSTVVPTTSAADFGRLRYPQQGSASRTVTYRNTGSEPVTLALTAALANPDGAAPAGMLTVTPSSVQVPAGGTADVTVALDTEKGTAGLYSGQIVATAGDLTLRTPVGAYKESLGHDLTVKVVDRTDAAAVARGSVIIRRTDVDTGEWIILPAAATVSEHLDEGVYAVTSVALFDYDTNELNNAVALADPQVELSADTTITLDMNRAVPMEVRTDRPTEEYGVSFNFWHQVDGSPMGFGEVTGQAPYGVKGWALPTERVTVGKFFFEHGHLLGTPVLTARVPELKGQGNLHPRYQHYSASVQRLDGKGRLPIVDVGAGEEADFARAKVRGKVALLAVGDRSVVPSLGAESVLPALNRAARAGAAAVLAYGNEGMPRLTGFQLPYSVFPLPTIAVPAAEGKAIQARLAGGKGARGNGPARGKATFHYHGQPSIPDVYTLSYLEQNQIPRSLTNRVRDRDLVNLRQEYHADRPVAQELGALPSWPTLVPVDALASSFSLLTLEETVGPTARTQHIGPVSDTTLWFRRVVTADLAEWLVKGPGHQPWYQLGGMYDYQVFTRPHNGVETWGEGPTPPSSLAVDQQTMAVLSEGPPCAVCRYTGWFSGDMMPIFTMTADEDGHYDQPTTYSNSKEFEGIEGVDEIHLYADGVELPQQSLVGIPGMMPYYELPDRPTSYRMTQHFEDISPHGGYGTKVDSEWVFRSQTPDGKEIPRGYDGLDLCVDKCGVQPLIFLRYDLDLNLDNRLPAGRKHVFTVEPYRQPTTAALPKIAGLRMEASYDDGRTWTKLHVRQLPDGTYRVQADHPRRPGSETVKLRTEAWDAAGNRIVQTLHNAYGLTTRR
ncbi:S8 family serine peptidase [Plantactinospora sp. B6F1]|uniref:S8 family peptidase n=1 Tax=Plantactinospora sp. B6F1 TaxID=3158971 RepID=UPI0032D920D2